MFLVIQSMIKKKEKALAELKNDFKDDASILSKIENTIKNPGDDDPFNLLLEDEQVGKILIIKIKLSSMRKCKYIY